jgi:hypothetical protein
MESCGPMKAFNYIKDLFYNIIHIKELEKHFLENRIYARVGNLQKVYMAEKRDNEFHVLKEKESFLEYMVYSESGEIKEEIELENPTGLNNIYLVGLVNNEIYLLGEKSVKGKCLRYVEYDINTGENTGKIKNQISFKRPTRMSVAYKIPASIFSFFSPLPVIGFVGADYLRNLPKRLRNTKKFSDFLKEISLEYTRMKLFPYQQL